MLQMPGGPRTTVDVLVAPMQARCVMLATRLGIFEALAAEPRSDTMLARALDVDADVLALILRLLWGAGYLWRENGCYGLTTLSRTDLVSSSEHSRRSHVLTCELFWNAMSGLEGALRRGRVADSHERLGDDRAWRTYQAAMLEGARHLAPLVVPLIPVRRGARRLLDLAGSHGFLGALICRAHPPMRAEVLELPVALAHSRALALEADIADVVHHRAGDILTADFGKGQDVVLLNNVLHHFQAAQARTLISRAARALSEGGTLSLLEFEPPQMEGRPDSMRDATALFFRVASAGRCHPLTDYRQWMREAGLREIREYRSRLLGYHCVIVATAS